jgi:beta-mannosidase
MWTLTCEQDGLKTAAVVPGDTLSALVAAGVVPDPYAGTNELDLQWLGKTGWTYARDVEVDAAWLAESSIQLSVEGVDTLAEIRINGKMAGRTENMFRRYAFEVKPLLQAGRNTIEVRLAAAEPASQKLSDALPYPVPHGINPIQSMNRNMLRKVQCHAGWDWGPCLMVAGIHGGITLQVASDARIAYVMTETAFTGRDAEVSVIVEADVLRDGDLALEIRIGESSLRETVSLARGAHRLIRTLRVRQVKRWWPNGLGEQHRYDLRVTLGTACCERKIGLRSLELVNKEDKTGLSMTFRVNGVDVFCKGANWIPADSMPQRQTPEVYENLLQSAADAHMNMIRVWGGGQYERDIFYDLCDAKGLLVWQDFMFACSLYPATPAFLDNVRAEVTHQVKRLRDHACIALWCGNNENLAALGWYQVSRDSRDRYLVDYDRLYEGTIGAAVDASDPTRTYWPCSPCAGRGDYSDCFHDDSRGDMHYWEVWHGGKSFSAYYEKIPRFCSEFGYQSFPSMEVIRSYASEDQFNVTAPVMEHHQRNKGGNSKIIDMFSRYFRMPMGFANFVYLSQVQQGVAIRTAVEYWRSLRPACMGTLFWQLNDCWPVCSWASLNYGGKWKILHYMAKRFYAPVMLTTFQRDYGKPVELWGVNDRLQARSGTLKVRLIGFDGKTLWRDEMTVKLPKNASKKLAEYPLEKLPAALHEAFLLTELTTEEGTVRNDLFLAEYKRCALPAATVKTVVVAVEDGFAVTLTSDAPAFFVTLDAEGVAGEFDDNAITLLSGESRTLRFSPKKKVGVKAFTRTLNIRHLQMSAT